MACPDRELMLSRYLDEELLRAEVEELEEHLRSCEGCRAALEEMRRTGRRVEEAVRSVKARPGFVRKVMAAIRRAMFPGAGAGSRLKRAAFVSLLALALSGLGAGIYFYVRSAVRVAEEPRSPLPIAVSPGERGWRLLCGRKELPLGPGSRLLERSELALDSAAAAGFIGPYEPSAWPHSGWRLHLAPGSRVEFGRVTEPGCGMKLLEGAALAVASEGRDFQLGLPGGASAGGATDAFKARFKATGGSALVTVLSGEVTLAGPFGLERLGPCEEAELRAGEPPVLRTSPDPRALALEFVPPELQAPPWPQTGGSPGRPAYSPFEARLPPRRLLRLDGVRSASATVIGPDGACHVLLGPSPGRLLRFSTGGEVILDLRLPGPTVGDPAVGTGGEVLFCVAERGLFALEGTGNQLKELARFKARTGPCVGYDGSIYVGLSDSLAAFDPGGRARWTRGNVVLSSPPSVGPDGTVYAASLAGRICVLSPETGEDRFPPPAPVDEAFLSSPAVSPDGTAYFVSARKYLVWVDARGRSARVHLPDSEYVLPPAVTPEGSLYLALSRGAVYELPARPEGEVGNPFHETGEDIVAGPLVDGKGRVLVWTKSGKLLAVDRSGHASEWQLGALSPAPGAVARSGALIFATARGEVYGSR